MEGSDVFAQEIGADDDPFAGTDFGDFTQEQPAAPPAQPEPARPVPEPDVPIATEGLPTVDREGNPVQPSVNGQPAQAPVQAQAASPPVTPPPGPSDPAAEAAAYDAQHAAPAPAQAVAPAPDPSTGSEGGQAPPIAAQQPQEPAPDPTPAASNGTTGSTTEPEPAPVPPTEPTADAPTDAPTPAPTAEPAPVADAPPAGGSEPEPSTPEPAADETQPSPEPTASTGSDDGGTEPASERDEMLRPEKKDKGGRVTHRNYLILRVEGGGRYSEVSWYEKGGDIVPQGTAGSKRQKYALARGQEDALKVGYAALGAPPRAHIVAVAVSSFQPKIVEPEAPRPERARLKIR